MTKTNTKRLKIGIDGSFTFTFDKGYSLAYPVKAEKAGFDHLWMGDHFLPWHHSFNDNFFAWEVLAAAAAKTKKIAVGPDVTVPIGGRYHPAIIAQAGATMDRLFPGRFALAVGTGEAMNESAFLGFWPKWPERMERLIEGITLIRKLWAEDDYFEFKGKYFNMGLTKLYLKPKTKIPIYFSGVGEKAAHQAGKYGDRLMTSGSLERLKDVIFPTFEAGARSVGKDPSAMEKAVLVNMATGTESKVADRIRMLVSGAGIPSMVNERDPRKIEKAGKALKNEEVLKGVLVFKKPGEVIESLSALRKIGVSQVIICDMSPSLDAAMPVYAKAIECLKTSA